MGKAELCPQCRKTRLSRYNNEPLCAACTRAAREPGSGTPSWLYDSPPMRRALARDDIPLFSVVFRDVTARPGEGHGAVAEHHQLHRDPQAPPA